MKVFLPLILLSLSFLGLCKQAEIPFTETDISLVSQVFEENQKIQDELLKDSPNLQLEGLSKAVDSLASSTHPRIQDWKSKLKGLIPKDPKDLEKSYENLSQIALVLVEIKQAVPVRGDFQQFYCPMVEKYWVAKGKQVKNPYAPEMRDCGDLVQ
ncbi:DUF3347 domain-containing protein [Leptospira idonii]|nr:DUF3347 domain-containing protein [Leptospira idonii]